MASYYKKINGKDYDRAMLEMAESSVKGQGDGRISLNDAKRIVKLIKDGGKITPIEKRSLQYILKKYKFTDTALDHIEQALGKTAAPKEVKRAEKKPAVPVKKASAAKEKASMEKKPSAVKKALVEEEEPRSQLKEKKSIWKYIIIMLLIILLIPAAYYLYSKYKSKNAQTEVHDAVIQSYSDLKSSDQKKAEDVSTALKEKSKEVNKPVQQGVGKTLYTIKENDTLVKISIAHYNDYRKWEMIWKHNKGVLKSPVLIFPGQVIELPEVKE